MLATSARESPCNAFCCASSLEREAMTLSPSRPNEIPSGNFRDSSPFGPFTDTVDPSMLTVTPFGTRTGILPIRDIVRPPLPDEGEQFAPGVGLASLLIGHEAARRAEDRHTQSVAHARNLGGADITTEAGRGDAAQLANDRLAARVTQDHAQDAWPGAGAV